MPVQFRCAHCSHTLSIGTHKVGSTIHCPICLGIVDVPNDTSDSPDTNAWWQDAQPATPQPAPAQPVTPAPTASAIPYVAPASPLLNQLPPLRKPAEPPPSRPVAAPDAPRTRGPLIAAIGGGLALVLGTAAVAVFALPYLPAKPGEPPIELGSALTGSNGASLEHSTHSLPVQPRPRSGRTQVAVQLEPSPEALHSPALELEPVLTPTPTPPRNPVKPAVVVKETPPPTEAKPESKLIIKRRVDRSEDELVKQIKYAPVLTFDRTMARAESTAAVQSAQIAAKAGRRKSDTTLALLDRRLDLAGLPLRRGEECNLTPSAIEHLEAGSRGLRDMLATATVARGLGVGGAAPVDGGATKLAALLMSDKGKFSKWLRAEAVPALMQLLMAENEAIREVLVDQLARIEGKEASQALAQRALFDLHPRVRTQALEALSKRPVKEYQEILIKGFEHPWPVVADHAAEAVSSLKLTDAIPQLINLLDQPDPQAPYEKPGGKVRLVKDMVRINHLMNCLMCHPPSLETTDKVRGFVPRTDQPISTGRAYYAQPRGTFVRASTTYLKQDFSIQLPVEKHGVWPELQRFDFVVRERVATEGDVKLALARKAAGPTEQQKATFFALRELTGKDPGPAAEDWKKLFLGRSLEASLRTRGFHSANGLTVDEKGTAYVLDGSQIVRQARDNKPDAWLKLEPGSEWSALALDRSGRLLAGRAQLSDVVTIDRDTKGIRVVATRFADRTLSPTRTLVADRNNGVYFTEDPSTDGKITGGVMYLSPLGNVSKVGVHPGKVRGLGLSPDGKTLYVTYANAPEVTSYPIESAGSLGRGKIVGRLTSSPGGSGASAGLTVDPNGTVYVLNKRAKLVEAFGPEGAILGRARLDEAPVACSMGGDKGKTLYVLTKTALYTVTSSEAMVTVSR